MRSEKLFRELGNIDPQIVEESEVRKVSVYRRPLAIAASLAILVTAVFAGTTLLHKEEPERLDLPTLQYSQIEGAYGCGGILVYDFADYHLNESGVELAQLAGEGEYEQLPVYKNNNYYKEDSGLSVPTEAQKEIVQKVATLFSFDPESLWDDRGDVVLFEADTCTVTIDSNLYMYISFKEPIEIAGETAVEKAKAAHAQYGSFLEAGDVSFEEAGGDVSFSGEKGYAAVYAIPTVLEGADAVVQKKYALSYLFNEDGKLSGIRYEGKEADRGSDCYPVISLEEAKELLKEGKAFTEYADGEFPGMDAIAAAELVYECNVMSDDYWLPYYCFWVEAKLPEGTTEEPLKYYVQYYVPAIEEYYWE